MRVLSEADVSEVLSLEALVSVVESAFVRQSRGAVERPERPHYPIGQGLDGDDGDGGDAPLGTGLAMPAYVHGSPYAVTKLATVHEDAPPGRPTVRSQVAVVDARTGAPVALLAGGRLTGARTGCIAGLAARELARRPVTLGVLGAGTQARWGTRAIAAATGGGDEDGGGGGLDRVRIYAPSDSRAACAADLRERGIDAAAVDSPRAAVANATVVLTATTATEPVFPADALAAGALVVGVGAHTPEARELPAATIERAARVIADVPGEVAGIGDLRGTGLDAGDLVSLGAVLDGRAPGRTDPGELLVVDSVGSATLDAAAAAHLVDRARDRGVGTDVALE